MKNSAWTVSLLFGALIGSTEACSLPKRITRYDLLNHQGFAPTLKGGSDLTGIDKFKSDWGIDSQSMHVEPWVKDESSYAVSWGYPGAWQKVSASLGDVHNLDILPFITTLTFEASMNSEYDNDLHGDKYTIKMAVSDTAELKEGELALYENK